MSGAGERYLIVSLGSIGRRHLANLRQLRPDSTIAALRQQAPPGAAVPGCDHQFHSLEQVRDFAPQAAIIAGPASCHAAMARALLDMGVHVLVEKPFADALDGLRELVATAERRGLTLMVGYNLRFNAALTALRAHAAEGTVGQILSVRAEVGQYLPDWRPGVDYRQSVTARAALGGGALLELSHEIDYVYWMFGLPQRVTARAARVSALEIDVDDVVELCLEYQQPRRMVSIHLDLIQRVPTRRCKLIGTAGHIVWDGIADTLEVAHVTPGRSASTTFPKPDRNGMYLDELTHFLDCVAGATRPDNDGIQAYEVMEIIDAARRSIARGTTEQPGRYA